LLHFIVAKFHFIFKMIQTIIIMKHKTSIREILGITQEKLAILLGVSRSQLSLYEIGKRSLPRNATIKLAELLKLVNEKTEQENNDLKNYEKKKIIEKLLENNQIKQYILDKNKNTLEKKINKQIAFQNLGKILKKETEQNKINIEIHQIIYFNNLSQKNQKEKFYEFEIKKELLLEEEQFLKKILEYL
jgi:transcriptional regulator with XRE-family HTH domain